MPKTNLDFEACRMVYMGQWAVSGFLHQVKYHIGFHCELIFNLWFHFLLVLCRIKECLWNKMFAWWLISEIPWFKGVNWCKALLKNTLPFLQEKFHLVMCPLDTLEIFYKFFTYFWFRSFNKEAKDHKMFLIHVCIKKGKKKILFCAQWNKWIQLTKLNNDVMFFLQ